MNKWMRVVIGCVILGQILTVAGLFWFANHSQLDKKIDAPEQPLIGSDPSIREALYKKCHALLNYSSYIFDNSNQTDKTKDILLRYEAAYKNCIEN